MSRTRALDLLLTLMQTLSHQVRTPLSVISNDLTFFQSIIEPSECERGILRCRQISDYFKPAQLLSNSTAKSEIFNMQTLLQEIFGSSLEGKSSTMQCQGIQNNLQQAFRWIAELFSVESVRFLGDRRSLKFNLAKPIEIKGVSKNRIDSHSNITSISEIYAADAGYESILPILIDAVFVSYSAECRIVAEREFVVVFIEGHND